MLKKRLVAVLILRDGHVVQSVQFRHTNIIHWKPMTAVDFFDRWAIDEMVILDVSRTMANRSVFYDVIEGLSRKCFVPLTVGGWITSVDEVRKLLRLGADKVAVNTAAVKDPGFLRASMQAFGSQCIVASIDVKAHPEGRYEVFVDRGREPTGLNPVDWAKRVEALGAGEIFLNCIDRDGARQGYDLNLLRQVVEAVGIPVVAMGGVFTWQHLVDGLVEGHAEAVAAANIFHYTEFSTKKAKEYLQAAGIPVRKTALTASDRQLPQAAAV